ncbi:hypothetical protein [Nonomuraea sp. NPDC049695]|uniref:hypothetical protein n=1 Tax=Nonomuraea sp. NPDC049695 TaxID=3154734 RepID=UPI003438DC7E
MPRKTITALALACALVAAPALTATPAAAAAKPNLRACYDGKCTFTFTKPVKFRVAKKYGLSGWVHVAKEWSDLFGTDVVAVWSGGSSAYGGEGTSGGINKLDFRVLSITGTGATIRFTG